MKATVSSSTLSGALGLVSRAVSPRSTLPVLSNVLLETGVDGLRVTATNLDLTITVVVAATVLEEGRTTVPARLLGEFVASLGDAPCTMELDPTTQVLKLTGGVHRANVHGIDAVEFPPLPARDTETSIEVDSVTLQNAITQTVMAASSERSAKYLAIASCASPISAAISAVVRPVIHGSCSYEWLPISCRLAPSKAMASRLLGSAASRPTMNTVSARPCLSIVAKASGTT